MNTIPVVLALVACVGSTRAGADDSFERLLPRPYWLRSHAAELNVDVSTRERLERIYEAAEPKYHELVEQIGKKVHERNEALSAEPLDEEAIVVRTKAWLDAESELSLYKTRVRLRLLSELTPEQRTMARKLAKTSDQSSYER